MKVRHWNTLALKGDAIKSLKGLISAIKDNGDVVTSFGPGDTAVNGYCLILGGRESIKDTLQNPGSFVSATGELEAMMARFSTGAFGKTYTVVLLTGIKNHGLFQQGWTPLSFTGEIQYGPGQVTKMYRPGGVVLDAVARGDRIGKSVTYAKLAAAVVGGSGAIMARTIDIMDEMF
ncbi:MAG: hypothetical protein QUS14_00940 [Pyrinomonadaceae bacterium]|nr:hypothetical protein [Pyrinomonadaceae bacterium]